MWRIAVRGLLAHKVRYALTALAVALGVAFIAGTYVLTDTIGQTFDGLYANIYRNTAAAVRAQEPFTPTLSWGSQRPRIDASVAERVRAVPGVTAVRVDIGGYAQLVGRNGKPVGNPGQGAPTLGQNWQDVPALSAFRVLPGGRPPANSHEVAIDKHSADTGHLKVGDRVVVLTKGPPQAYRVSGIVTWDGLDSPLGASITMFDPATAARVLGTPGQVDQVDVAAAPGVSQQALVTRIRQALADPRLDVVTGAQITHDSQSEVRKAFAFFGTFLLVFALIALFVGSFLIFNTFSIVVTQRLREMALLRAVGASSRQVVAAVLGESVALGAVASLAGLVAGIGLAQALQALLKVLGIDIPSTGLVLRPRTVAVALAVGIAVTVLAAVVPARRAAGVPPVAALRDVAVEPAKSSRRQVVFGAAGTLVGAAGLISGLAAPVGHRIIWVGAGAAAVFVGLAALSPLYARRALMLLGAPLARGVPGELARANSVRNPRRSAATAAALMVGVALMSLMSVLASSLQSSVGAIVDSHMRADLVVSTGSGPPGASGLSPSLQRSLDRLPQVAAVTGIRLGLARLGSTQVALAAVDPRQVGQLFDVGVVHGEVARMTTDGIAVSQLVASAHGWRLGSAVALQFTRTGTQRFTVQAIFTARELAGDYVVPLAAAVANFGDQMDYQDYVRLAPGVSLEAGRRAVTRVVSAYPTAKVLDRAQFKAQQAGQINQLLNLVDALLLLALVIALMGVANALSLSIHERTRELGLLRAVGMTRPQLRRTLRLESLLVSLFGALQGVVVGVLFGIAVVAALRSQGVSRVTVPAVQLVGLVVAAAAAGMLAAVRPGRRAARLDILRAIATE